MRNPENSNNNWDDEEYVYDAEEFSTDKEEEIVAESVRHKRVGERYLSTSHLPQRAFQWQYPKAYFDLFQDFHRSLWVSGRTVEGRGFVHILDDRRFLLVPSLDKLDMGIICIIGEGQNLPDDHAYVNVKGYRTATLERRSIMGYPCLEVEDCFPLNMPELFIKPDITFNDFRGLMFDNWSDIPEYIANSISLSIVSSPGDAFRMGGLTTDLFLDREQKRDYTKAKELVRDIHKRIDPYLFEPWNLKLPIGRFSLNPFKWKHYSPDADRLDSRFLPYLERRVALAKEVTLNLASSLAAPPSPEDIPVSKADMPLILGPAAEKGSATYRDQRITNYITATHMNRPAGPPLLIDSWRSRIQQEMDKIRQQYSDSTPFVKLVNPDLHGTPLSVIHLAYAFSRTQASYVLTDDTLDQSLRLISQSFRTALEKWLEIGRAQKRSEDLLRTASSEQRRIYFYLTDNPDTSRYDVKDALFPNMNVTLFEEFFDDMYRRGLIFESLLGKYRAI